ncbi:MAG: amino acid deaminase [Acidobacteriota bacterium]|nr:amino acid deaminase [Acidobacteriota bacterium]
MTMRNSSDSMATDSLNEIGTLEKGVGLLESAEQRAAIAAHGWNLLHEDLPLPAAVLYQEKIRHNLTWMKQFIASYGLQLAPHGKTTMAPGLFQMQLDAGAWGITLATAHQTHVAYAHGVSRVMMANQLVGKANMELIARMLPDPGFDFYCIVDSVEGVDQLGHFFAARDLRIQVLLELGVMGGRTGVRDEKQLAAVLAALERHKEFVVLCGIELYEGVLHEESEIRAFLRHATALTKQFLAEKRFARTPAILSGAGSAWYDVVAEEFHNAQLGEQAEMVLRPGCYLTYDVGSYRKAQDRILAGNPIAREMHSNLLPALHVWAYVQSIPECEKAIIAMGKRDAAFDSGLPVPALHYRPGASAPQPAPAHWSTTKMMDQHAFLQISEGDDLRVGDMIGFDIAHPCLTFDKWRVLSIVDADFNVVDAVRTFF